ncbi:hypothetical protein SR882_08425 [Guyparkeria halophila]|uniref:YniB family protein n=1 Tax=Guyparkeria halophila TaxID=47960 RepID=A0ABZ0YWW1_9GAMM|nr:hypothetical protein [Guyparkeria halophila]WQH15782.1 hypothetical protein SR882_08425 [Guyparkeria halophila]
MKDDLEIALKAWSVYQDLIRDMGGAAWKIKSVCFTVSAGIISYGFTSGESYVFLVASFLSLIFLMLESGFRCLQDQIINKSLEIERTINGFIAHDDRPVFPDSVGTDLDAPRMSDLRSLFSVNRFLFWLPYLILFVVPIILWQFFG